MTGKNSLLMISENDNEQGNDAAELLSTDNPSVKGVLHNGVFLPAMLRQNRVIDLLSIGVILVDLEQKIIWENRHFREWASSDELRGSDFYKTLGESEIEGPDFCPFSTVRRTRLRTKTTVRIERQTFELFVSPITDPSDGRLTSCVVEMRDITEITRVDETLKKLQDVGRQLADLSGEELMTMSVEDRRELLNAKVEESMRKILNYDVVEFRLLEESTNRLVPLLAFGIDQDAAQRELYAASNGNGITGYVAHNKVCYYCEETIEHPLYLVGAIDARCSMTIPLMWHDKVIGTCNVESRTPGAFSERDLYFLQIFTRDVAAAIHTFNLLSHEKEIAVQSSIDAVFGSVSSPIDQILQSTSVLLDEYLGHQPQTSELLRKILENSRVIKDHIAMVRKKMVSGSTDIDQNVQERPILSRRRILVIDKDEEVLRSAHKNLELYNCVVETAPDALVALKMIRVTPYDAILCEIKPDGGMSGYQLMLRLFDLYPDKQVVPLLLMTGFGYDPGHTIVSAKQKGLIGVLFKPFVRKQLLNMLEQVINVCGRRDAAGNLIPPHEPDESGAPIVPAYTPPVAKAETADPPRGFCQIQGGGRFSAWAGHFPENSADAAAERPSDRPADDFDAT